jgi:hypothetical protein
MNSKHDENRIPTLAGTLNTDGQTFVNIKADATTHKLFAVDGHTGTDYGPVNAKRDENRVPVLMAVSSVDGVTPVAVYADANGQLLIQNT